MVKEQKVFEAMLKRWMKGERLATFDTDGGHFVTPMDIMVARVGKNPFRPDIFNEATGQALKKTISPVILHIPDTYELAFTGETKPIKTRGKDEKYMKAVAKDVGWTLWVRDEAVKFFGKKDRYFVTAHDEMRVLVVEGDPEKHMQVLGYIIPAIDRPN